MSQKLRNLFYYEYNNNWYLKTGLSDIYELILWFYVWPFTNQTIGRIIIAIEIIILIIISIQIANPLIIIIWLLIPILISSIFLSRAFQNKGNVWND